MTGFLWAALGVVGTLGMTAIGDMVSEEVRDRLDHLPHAILRLAARRLDPEQRTTVYDDEWMPELTYILKGDDARPITRLYHGTRYALGILMSAHRIKRQLKQPKLRRPRTAQPDHVEVLFRVCIALVVAFLVLENRDSLFPLFAREGSDVHPPLEGER